MLVLALASPAPSPRARPRRHGRVHPVLVVLDAAKRPSESETAILRRLAGVPTPRWLVLNKVDLLHRPDARVDEATALYREHATFDATFAISAAKGDGLEPLMVGSRPQGAGSARPCPRPRAPPRPSLPGT